MVISAPTGSGKTVIMELCILRLLSLYIDGGTLKFPSGQAKTVYVGPSRALVQVGAIGRSTNPRLNAEMNWNVNIYCEVHRKRSMIGLGDLGPLVSRVKN